MLIESCAKRPTYHTSQIVSNRRSTKAADVGLTQLFRHCCCCCSSTCDYTCRMSSRLTHPAWLHQPQLRHLRQCTIPCHSSPSSLHPSRCYGIPQLLRGRCLNAFICKLQHAATRGGVINILCYILPAARAPVCDAQPLPLVAHVGAYKDGA